MAAPPAIARPGAPCGGPGNTPAKPGFGGVGLGMTETILILSI